jgi:hypothetical protein
MTVVCVAVEMVCITQTMVFSNEKIFLTAETFFLVNQKMVEGFATIIFVSQAKVSGTPKMVKNSPTML